MGTNICLLLCYAIHNMQLFNFLPSIPLSIYEIDHKLAGLEDNDGGYELIEKRFCQVKGFNLDLSVVKQSAFVSDYAITWPVLPLVSGNNFPVLL